MKGSRQLAANFIKEKNILLSGEKQVSSIEAGGRKSEVCCHIFVDCNAVYGPESNFRRKRWTTVNARNYIMNNFKIPIRFGTPLATIRLSSRKRTKSSGREPHTEADLEKQD